MLDLIKDIREIINQKVTRKLLVMLLIKWAANTSKAVDTEKTSHIKAKWDNAADVGTLAFVKNGRIAPGDDISDKDFNRKWFLFEDQTEDVAPIAYLVANCGYSSEDIKGLVYSANNNVKKNGKANELEYSLLNLGPTEAADFARKCEEVINEARQ